MPQTTGKGCEKLFPIRTNKTAVKPFVAAYRYFGGEFHNRNSGGNSDGLVISCLNVVS